MVFYSRSAAKIFFLTDTAACRLATSCLGFHRCAVADGVADFVLSQHCLRKIHPSIQIFNCATRLKRLLFPLNFGNWPIVTSVSKVFTMSDERSSRGPLKSNGMACLRRLLVLFGKGLPAAGPGHGRDGGRGDWLFFFEMNPKIHFTFFPKNISKIRGKIGCNVYV